MWPSGSVVELQLRGHKFDFWKQPLHVICGGKVCIHLACPRALCLGVELFDSIVNYFEGAEVFISEWKNFGSKKLLK